MRFNLHQALSRTLTFLAGVLLGLLLAASTDLAGAAPLRIGPPLPSPYYHIDRATPVASGRLDTSYLESQCNNPRSAATTPGAWYVFSPTAGTWRHDHPWGPFHGLVIAQSSSGIWYRADIGGDMYTAHEDAIATGLWSGSDWISEVLLLPGAGRSYPAFLFQAPSSTLYFRVPDFDCPDNTAGSVGDPAAYNERFLDWALYRVYFDTAAPLSTLALSGVPGDNGWFRSPVTASLSATDPESLPTQPASGLAALRLNGTPYGGPLSISAQGSTALRYYATDNAGNLEAERTQNVRIDSGAPSLSVRDPGSAWSGTVSFSGTASDAVSGLALVQLSFDGGSSWQAASGAENWTYALDSATLPDGPLAWQVRAIDQAGNSSLIATGSAVSDNSAPQVQITEPAGASVLSGSATLRGTATDAGAGLDRVELSLDGGTTWQLAAGTDSWVYLFDSASLPEGPLTLQARAIDLAGLTSPLDTVTVRVDNQPPTVSIDSPAAGAALRGPVTVTGGASDSGSGLDRVEVSLDGGATWTPASGTDSWSYSFDSTGMPDGPLTLQARAIDLAGLTSPLASRDTLVDQTPPTLAISAPVNGAPLAGMQTLSGAASDSGSGLALVEVSLDGGASWQPASGTENWSLPFDTTALPDGPLSVLARASDHAGNLSSTAATADYLVDNGAPGLSITAPAPGSLVHGTIQISGTASDGGSGLDRVEVSLDSGATWQPATGTDSWTFPLDTATLPDGLLTVQARAVDRVGLLSPLASRDVFVDNQAPTVSIDSPAAGAALRGPVTVTGSASDSGSGLDRVEVSLDNGATWLPASGTDTWTYSFDASPLPDGPLTLQARAIDLAGLTSPLASRDTLVDQTPPVLSISAPVNGAPLAGLQTLSGTASDSGSGLTLVEVSLDGGASWQAASGTENWSLPFDSAALPDGPLSVLARATDHAGNLSVSSATADYLVDNGAPGLSITAPTPGSLVHGTIQVSGTAADTGAGLDRVEVSLDGGATWQPAAGTDSWTFPLDTATLPDGPLTVQARAVDSAGNGSAIQTLDLLLDNGLPAVSVSAPSPGSLLSGTVAVTGTASDSGSSLDRVELSLDNGVTWLPATGTDSWSYSLDTSTLADGLLSIQARALDQAGNVSPVASLDAQVDNTPASVQISSPLPGAALSGPVQVTGTAADSGAGLSRVEVSLDNGASWQPASGTDNWRFNFDSLALPEGPLNIQARAIDLVGNPGAVETRSILLDHSAPTLAIQSPAPGSAVAGPVQIIGTAADAGSGVTLVEVSLDGGTTWQPAAGTDSWSLDLDSTLLPDGPLSIQVRATDGAGNQSSVDTLALQVDNAPGLVAITSPSAGALLSGQRPVSGMASDAGAGLDRVELSLDEGATWQPATGTENWSFDLDTTLLPDGLLTIQARSIDSAGNASPAEALALVVDNSPPSVQIELPLAGAALSGLIPVSGQAADSTSGVERVELSFDGGATWHRASGAALWSLNWDTRALPDGPLSILARAVDRAGLTAQDQRPVSLGNGNSGSPAPAATPQTLPVSDPGPALLISDPALSKSGSPERARLGELITWTITVSNPGNQPIPDLVLLDPLPAGLEVISAETPQGAHFIEGRTVRFVLGALQPGQTLSLTVLTRVTEGALGSEVCNTAQVPGLDASPAACVALIPDALPVTGGQPVEPFRLTLWQLLAGLVALLTLLLLVYGLRRERSL